MLHSSLPGSRVCGVCPASIEQGPGHTPAPAVVGKKGTRWWYQGNKGMDRKAAIAAQQRAEQAAKEVTEQAMTAAQACLPTCPNCRAAGCQIGAGMRGIGDGARPTASEIGLGDIIRVRPCALTFVTARKRRNSRTLVAHAQKRACALTRQRALARTYSRTGRRFGNARSPHRTRVVCR